MWIHVEKRNLSLNYSKKINIGNFRQIIFGQKSKILMPIIHLSVNRIDVLFTLYYRLKEIWY